MTAQQDRTASTLGHPLVIAAIGTVFAAYSGFLTGETKANERLGELERRIDGIEVKLRGRGDFTSCAVRHIDAIEGGGRKPDCQMTIPE